MLGDEEITLQQGGSHIAMQNGSVIFKGQIVSIFATSYSSLPGLNLNNVRI